MTTIDARKRPAPSPGSITQLKHALEANEQGKQDAEALKGAARLARADADAARLDS